MKTRLIMMLLGVCLLAGSSGLAQDVPWADWQVESYESGDATYSPDFTDEEAPLIKTVLTEDSGQSGDPYTDLQDALALLWLDMNEVEAVDVSQPDKLVVWGDVESEYGERRFAAVLETSPDGPLVTAFVAMPEDFEAMGGAAFVGGNPEAAQSLESAQASGAAALQPGASGTGEASETGAGEAGADETSAEEASETSEASAEPADDAPAVAEPSLQPDADPSIPLPIQVTREDGSVYIPGWRTEDEGLSYIAEPVGAASPRHLGAKFELDRAASLEEAQAEALEYVELEEVEVLPLRPIPSHEQIAGDAGYITFGTARRGGEAQNLAMYITQDDEDGQFSVFLLHAPPATYKSWDGVLGALMTLGGFVDDPDVFGAALRQELREASPEEQSEIFAQVAELRIQTLMQEMLATWMMQQQSTLGMMQQMNANIATETSCILTPGCQIEYDGNGDAQMNQP